ncbi:MAG: maleylpyruvate isomerase family mycothiol-dependent enzyme [Acidimicrobiales bacterium]
MASALDETARLIAGVGDDQWAAPTPCDAWTVSDLVNHLIGGNNLFAGVLAGEPAPPGVLIDPSQLVDGFRGSAGALLAAFGAPGTMDRVVRPSARVPSCCQGGSSAVGSQLMVTPPAPRKRSPSNSPASRGAEPVRSRARV